LGEDAEILNRWVMVAQQAMKDMLNMASSSKFSSDRTIAEYASGIWNVRPCPVP
jgi:starch phosphorylase